MEKTPVDLYSSALIAIVVVATVLASDKLHTPSPVLEVIAGILLGGAPGVRTEPWLDFLGTFGGLALTFLAGAEIELALFRQGAEEKLGTGYGGLCTSPRRHDAVSGCVLS